MERKAWPLVDEVAMRFPDVFKQNAELLYRVAESQVARKAQPAAEETATAAAAPTTVAPLHGETSVRAFGGVQAWSDLDPADKQWHVMVRSDGQITSPPRSRRSKVALIDIAYSPCQTDGTVPRLDLKIRSILRILQEQSSCHDQQSGGRGRIGFCAAGFENGECALQQADKRHGEVKHRPWPLSQRPGFLIRRMHKIHVALFQEACGEFEITPLQ